jgi:hypothetical protein
MYDVQKQKAESSIHYVIKNKKKQASGCIVQITALHHCTAGIKKIYYAISGFPKKHRRGRKEKSMDNKCTNNA